MNTPIIQLLKDKAVDSLLKTISKSKLKPYSDEERRKTDAKVAEILKKKKRINNCRHYLSATTACNRERDACCIQTSPSHK